MSRLERETISEALRSAGGRKIVAARLLGISRPTLDKKIEDYGLTVERRRV
ncbi:helix-turn-helix domain-containing protein [Cystobacter fuscus]